MVSLLHLVPSVAGLKTSGQESEEENIFPLTQQPQSLLTVHLANQTPGNSPLIPPSTMLASTGSSCGLGFLNNKYHLCQPKNEGII